MDADSFTSLAWPEPGEEPGKEPAELTPTETTDALLPPECQLANPINYREYFGPDSFESTAFPTRPSPRVSEVVQPNTASWPTDDEVRPIMSVADWVRVANSRRGEETLELKQDWGVRPTDTLLQARDRPPDPAPFPATYGAYENDNNTAKPHAQDAGENGAPRKISADDMADPANKKAKVSTKAGNRKDDAVDLAKRTCESCGTVFKNWQAKK